MADQNKKEEFSWTDDEVQLLLEAILAFKSTCEYEGISWESVKSKYQKIADIFIERYPTDSSEEFPRGSCLHQLTKERMAAKIKRIRGNYKKAVDAGRRSGGGRIVLTFYDLCDRIWGGSPAVQSIDGAIDSSEVLVDPSDKQGRSRELSVSPAPSQANETSSTFVGLNEFCQSGDEEIGDERNDDNIDLNSLATKERRAKISELLKNRKDNKMTNKLSCETQMLNCAKDDLNLKRKMAENMEKSDTELSETIKKVNKTMESIGQSIKEGFSLMAEIMKSSQQNVVNPGYVLQSQMPQSSNVASVWFSHPGELPQQYQHFNPIQHDKS